MRRLRMSFPVAAAVLAATALIPGTASAAGISEFSRYAALGDSYTSSPLTGWPVGPNGYGCTRSHNNYPHVAAAALAPAEFADLSCGGATTDDVFQPHSGPLGGTNDPQISIVTADTTLVTVSFGGNDIGFSQILEDCASPLPWGTPCRDRYTSGGVDQLAARIAATAPKMDSVLAAVRERARSASVFVVGYPAILPDTGGGCWPRVPYTSGDVYYLRNTEKRLNAMLRDRAAAAGMHYADLYTGSIGHDVCQGSGVRWIEGLVPSEPAAPVHPNALGSAGMANLLLAAIAAST